MSIKKPQHTKGFTLIELLVSIALFSVVLTIALGAILTIADSNKKTRTLMSVMNNLNFAVDSMTRSFKSGDVYQVPGNPGANGGDCFSTREANYQGGGSDLVTYCVSEEGQLTKTKEGSTIPLTSSDVEITKGLFKVFGGSSGQQPQLIVILEGEVKINEKIKSQFSIHTSVSQRILNI